MTTLMTLSGIYLIWFALRVSVFNYESEDYVSRHGSAKDKQIYWGSLPVMFLGIIVIAAGFFV